MVPCNNVQSILVYEIISAMLQFVLVKDRLTKEIRNTNKDIKVVANVLKQAYEKLGSSCVDQCRNTG